MTLQQLALLKGFNLDGMDVVGPDFIHLLVECSKLAYADREKFYGDPDFVRCRSIHFYPTPTTTSAASSSPAPRRWSCAPARLKASARW